MMTGALVIRCGEHLLAVGLDPVLEVFRMVATSARLPRAPRHCLGVIDWRGQLVPVLDLGARLGLTAPRNEAQLVDGHVVVVIDSVGVLGYAVDEVRELNEHLPERLPTSSVVRFGGLTVGAVRCSDGRLAPLVEHAALLTVLAREQLREAMDALRDAEAEAELGGELPEELP
jgi:purine-binding chemotaxis protein CheW